jgi:cytochrome c-type biogenesis protein CcmH/NrfG
MLITTTDIQLYEILKQKLGNKEAEALVGFVDSRIKETNEQNLKILTTKEDLKNLELKLTQQIDETKLKIAETKTDIIRWVFAFFIPLMLAILGLYVRK